MKININNNVTVSLPRHNKKKETAVGFAMAGLLATLAYAPIPAGAEVLSVPKLTETARGYNGTNTNISDYNSVTALETGINQLRRNEEAIMGLCPNSIATLDLPDQATWNNYNADQKALLIVNEERRARGGVIYPNTQTATSGDADNGPRGAVQGYPFSGVPKVVDDAAEWWIDWLQSNNKGIRRHCDNAAPANRRCPDQRIRDFGGTKTPHGGLEGMAGLNETQDANVGIAGILMFTYGTTGHRYGVLSQNYQDDFGNKREEGYVGFGTAPGMLAFKMGDTPSDAYMKTNGNLTYTWNAKTSDLPGCTRFLEATYPNGAQAIVAGANFTVNWNTSSCYRSIAGLDNISIKLSVDGGKTYPHTLAASTPVADGQETVSIPANINTTAAVIKIESTGSTCHYFSDVLVAPELPVVGIDFDAAEGPSPNHWKKLTDTRNQTVTNLKLDDGAATSIGLTVNATNCGVGGCAFKWNKAGSDLPKHIQSLKEAGGTAVARGAIDATFNGLTANAQYRVFVMSTPLFGDVDQKVSITGTQTVQFDQKTGGNKLLVNDNSGKLPLAAYGKLITSKADGTIDIRITPNQSGGEMMLAGLAIQAVSGGGTGTGTGTPSSLRINVAGSGLTTSMGDFTALPAAQVTGGTDWNRNNAVANTTDDALYQRMRYGQMQFNIPVSDGSYTVRLHFADLYWTTAGKRVFNIDLEGNRVLSNFDVIAEAGSNNTALVKTFTVQVSDQNLDLDFINVTDNAIISGIEIIPGASSGDL